MTDDEEFDWDEFSRAMEEIERALDQLALDFGLQMAKNLDREIMGPDPRESRGKFLPHSVDPLGLHIPLVYPVCLN